ncbi:MAG: hypothetical protein PUD24_06135 [Oscillospiraceae bacterium]|nr:hypothetical protein [Oscillospiraceae bacterium]
MIKGKYPVNTTAYKLWIPVWAGVNILLSFLYFLFIKSGLNVYCEKMCVTDYVSFFIDSYSFNIFVLPFTAVAASTSADTFNTANCITRGKSKKQLLREVVVRAAVNSLVLTALLLAVLIFIGGIFSGSFFNWNSTSSYYFITNSYVSELNVFLIYLNFGVKVFVSFLFFSDLMILLDNFIKAVYAKTIVLILCVINTFSRFEYALSLIFTGSANENAAIQLNSIIVYYVIVPILCVICCISAVKTAVKKDYYCE